MGVRCLYLLLLCIHFVILLIYRVSSIKSIFVTFKHISMKRGEETYIFVCWTGKLL